MALAVILADPQDPVRAVTPPDAPLPPSHEEIVKGLRRPWLTLPPLPQEAPTFRIEAVDPVETALDAMRRDLRENPVGPWTLVRGGRAGGTDILGLVTGAVKMVQRARYAADERRIHQEVTAELDEFCRIHGCSTRERLAIEGMILPE